MTLSRVAVSIVVLSGLVVGVAHAKKEKNKPPESSAKSEAAAPAAPSAGAALKAANMTPERKAACEKLCDVRDNASCAHARPMADCVKSCEAGAGATPDKCLKKWDEWVVGKTQGPWDCDKWGFPHNGNPPDMNGASGYVTCTEPTAGSEPMPVPKIADCTMSGFERYCDMCVLVSCPEVSLACARDKECRALNECLLTCNPSGPMEQKSACTAKCTTKHAAGKEHYTQMNACIDDCSTACHMTSNFVGYGLDNEDGYSTRNMLRECAGVFP